VRLLAGVIAAGRSASPNGPTVEPPTNACQPGCVYTSGSLPISIPVIEPAGNVCSASDTSAAASSGVPLMWLTSRITWRWSAAISAAACCIHAGVSPYAQIG
jgi:hypothetical protein